MTNSSAGILIFMILYLVMMIIIGVAYSKKNKTVGDYYLGGRKLGPFVTAMSAEASDMSSYLLMGLPGLAYISGLADVTWTAIGLAVGTYLNWLFVAKRIRRYSAKANNAITIPEFFSNRYHDNKKILSMIAAIIIIIFFVPYTASGFAACGKLFHSLFGLDYHVAMLISAAIIVFYTLLGGFLAASTTDLIQSIVMTISLIAIVIFGIINAGGWGAVVDNASKLPGYLSMSATHAAESMSSAPYGPLTVISTLAWGLGYFGMPHILLRFMAIKDDSKLKLSRRVASIWVVISMGIAILIGVIGVSLSANGTIVKLTGNDSETIIVKIADVLSKHGILCALIAGVALAGILAATMSTADSQLLAASSAVSHDIMEGTFKKKMSDKAKMLAARGTLISIAVVAFFFAWNPNSSVFKIVSFAWAGFGAAFGPLVLFSLFWKRTNFYGALAGIVSGGVTVFVWKYLVRPLGGAWNIYELLPAFIVSALMIVIVSLVTPKPSKEIQDEFEEVRAMK